MSARRKKPTWLVVLLVLTGCAPIPEGQLPAPIPDLPTATESPLATTYEAPQPAVPLTGDEDTGLVIVEAVSNIDMGPEVTPYTPLPNATLRIYDDGQKLVAVIQTDDTGQFQLRLLPGIYALRLMDESLLATHFASRQTFEVKAGQITAVRYTVTIPFT